MTSTINASTTAGIVTTADTSGVLALQTAGTTAVTVDASQNVGIGGAPTQKLDVYGGAGAAVSLVRAASGQNSFFSVAGNGNTFLSTSFDLVQDSTNLAQIAQRANAAMAFSTNNTERMRIDSSGNVGIGNASPISKLTVGTASYGQAASVAQINGTSMPTANAAGIFNIGSTDATAADVGGSLGFTANGGVSGYPAGQISCRRDSATSSVYSTYMAFTTSNSGGTLAEKMRIDSSGNLLIGTTAINTISPRLTILGMTAGNQWSCGPTSGNDSFFIYNQSSVGVYLGYGNTSWSSSSDERIKTAITPFENALEKVCTLRAGTGRYLTDEESVSRSFLIAQDVQKVLPEAINIQDDEIGTLGLQYTDVIPLLVAAIKEQQALITQLQADVAALKGA